MSEVSFLIDPEGIADILCGEGRGTFDDPSCLEVMDDTASNPTQAHSIVVPKAAILEPYETTQIECRNLIKSHLSVSDTLIGDDLPDLSIMHISDDEG